MSLLLSSEVQEGTPSFSKKTQMGFLIISDNGQTALEAEGSLPESRKQ